MVLTVKEVRGVIMKSLEVDFPKISGSIGWLKSEGRVLPPQQQRAPDLHYKYK